MALAFFTITGLLKAIRTDGVDVGGDPDTQFISSTVWFAPSVQQVHSATELTVFRIQPVRARTDVADGVLRTINGDTGVKLVANTVALGIENLWYDVKFEDVVYDVRVSPEPVIDGFRFLAPTAGGVTLDMATVDRLPVPRAGRR